MAHTILVPLDGSGFAEQALEPAADIARRTGARLELATAYCSQMPAWRTSGAPMHDPRMDGERIGELKRYLEQAASRVAHDLDVSASGVLLHGSAAEVLARHIAERPPQLVVMTTHGRGGLSRFWLGSVAEDLMRLAHSPILVLKPREGEPLRSFAPREILVPLDGSERAERVIEDAAWLSARESVRFTLLRIVAPPLATPYPTIFAGGSAVDADEVMAAAQDRLQLATARLSARGFQVDGRVVLDSEVARAILAASGGTDLIAMATHGFDAVRRLLVGTVADKVVRAAQVPVLLRRA